MYNQGKIMRRLLGRSTNDSSSSNDTNIGVASSPVPQSYRPNASQNAVYPTGTPIACLDRSPDGQFAVLGGRHILKTVRFDGLNIREGIDARDIIKTQQTSMLNVASIPDQLSIKDVKWTTNESGAPIILTACANGRIFQYDISRLGSATPGGSGLEIMRPHEGSRQVNALDINPHKNNWLLSGNQDGIVRSFDGRQPVNNRNGQATFRAFQAYKCNEGVRDVKWSPTDGVSFACATEGGAVLKWDFRKPNVPLLKINNAHDTQRGATSISWHPDGDHLISAGQDSKCHVWDLSARANRKQKPKWSISTPAPVSVVTWRPALWSATAQGRRAAQVAVSYDDGGTQNRYGISSVHIWDLGRPTMPFKEIDVFDSSPNALLWHDQDRLWTAGSDGLFTQCDVAFAPKVIDRQPLSSVDFSPRGDVLMFLEERAPPPRPRPAIIDTERLPAGSYSSSPSGQMLSISRSDSEDDVVGSFLGPRQRGARKRRASTRSIQTFSTTPPTGGAANPVIPLGQGIEVTGVFKPQQVMAIGRVPASSKVDTYQYLSAHYLETLQMRLPYGEGSPPLNERVTAIMEHYARAAENVSQFRLAQTWRILSYAMNLLLTRRSQYHLEIRINPRKRPKSPNFDGRTNSRSNLVSLSSTSLRSSGEETPQRPQSTTSADSRQFHSRSLLAEELDSESNVPTPLARPVREIGSEQQHQDGSGALLTPVRELDSFTLPPALHSVRPGMRKRLDSVPLSIMSHDSQISSTDGYDFYDLDAVEALPMAIDVPKKKEPLSLEYMGPRTPNSRKLMMARHDSDESFAQMFSVSDGSTNQQISDPTGSYTGSIHRGTRPSRAGVGSSEIPEDEFESRIRGKQIQQSPERTRQRMPRLPEGEESGSLREIFMISQTTASTGGSDNSPEQLAGRSYESAQQRADQSHNRLGVNFATSPRKTSNERLALERPEDQTSPTITETDFMPWHDDPPYPYPLDSDMNTKVTTPPFQPYSLLSRALAFESRHSALNASAMILLLKPLVPDDLIDSYQAAAILRQHHNRLMNQKLFVEAALLRNLCVRDWPDGIDIWGDNYTAVFTQAQQKVKAAFTCSQCKKPRDTSRKTWDQMGIWKCERCRAIMAPCAICGHRDATPASLSPVTVADGVAGSVSSQESPILSTWWYCPGCSHGGHSTCLQGWHAPVKAPKPSSKSAASALQDTPYAETYSDGCCPLDGCGHACLPGKWRSESRSARTEELGRVVREQTRSTISALKSSERRLSSAEGMVSSAPAAQGVRSDVLEVAQSRAVEGVREALAKAGITGGSAPDHPERTGRAGGILSVLSSSPKGTGSGTEGRKVERIERERRKSVKFAGSPESG